MNQQAPALIGLTHGVEAIAGAQGDTVLVADPNNDAATQVQQVTAWIENKQVQAIWMLPLQSASMAPVLEKAQEVIAKHYYRPTNPAVKKATAERFPAIDLFAVTPLIAPNWDEIQTRFFNRGGMFDQIYTSGTGK